MTIGAHSQTHAHLTEMNIKQLKNEIEKSNRVFLKELGEIPTDMGFAIKSNRIIEVFKHKKSIPIKSIKFDKSTLYEKKLPSIALIVVLIK